METTWLFFSSVTITFVLMNPPKSCLIIYLHVLALFLTMMMNVMVSQAYYLLIIDCHSVAIRIERWKELDMHN